MLLGVRLYGRTDHMHSGGVCLGLQILVRSRAACGVCLGFMAALPQLCATIASRHRASD